MSIDASLLNSVVKLHKRLNGVKENLSAKVISKAETVDKQLFYCVVLEPMTDVTPDGDAHGHVMSTEEIEKSAHEYMLTGPVIYAQHVKKTDAKVVENYIAPVDFTPEGSDEVIKKGSWVMGVKVFDDVVWESIKKGDITSFSPGGYGIVTNLPDN